MEGGEGGSLQKGKFRSFEARVCGKAVVCALNNQFGELEFNYVWINKLMASQSRTETKVVP